VIALTGATSGIGRRAAVTLAERGATVAAVGRNRERGEALAAESDAAAGTIRFHRADLATQSAVRDLAAELRESYDRLDVLAHNAGLSVRSRTETADGIELTLAVNHLAPYLLTRELFDQLAGSAPAGSSSPPPTSIGVRRSTSTTSSSPTATTLGGVRPIEARERRVHARTRRSDPGGSGSHGELPPSGVRPLDEPVPRRRAPNPARGGPHRAPARRRDDAPSRAADRLVRLVASPEYAERTGRYVGEEEMTPADDTVDSETRERLWSVSADLVGIDPDWP